MYFLFTINNNIIRVLSDELKKDDDITWPTARQTVFISFLSINFIILNTTMQLHFNEENTTLIDALIVSVFLPCFVILIKY